MSETHKYSFIESDDEFEGVGAHPENPRYDQMDEVGGDEGDDEVPDTEQTDPEVAG